MVIGKEDKKILEELKQKFLEVKKKLKENPDEKLFPRRVCLAIKIIDEVNSILYKDEEITFGSDTEGKTTRKLYEKYSIWGQIYHNIYDITNFEFLQQSKFKDNVDVESTIKLFNLFKDICIPQIDENGNSITFFDYGNIYLFDYEKIYDDFELKRKMLYDNILKQNIQQMYALQSLIETKYYYYTNRTQYEDFKKKYKTITEIAEQSQKLAEEYKKISIKCFKYAFGWFLLCWFAPIFFDWLRYVCDCQYNLPQDYFGEIFIFLSKLLFKLPSFVLCLVGVKFLYLFVQYKTEKRELSMLDSYLEKIPNDRKPERAELVRQLASHFFPDKKSNKISQGFLQELMLKFMDKKE